MAYYDTWPGGVEVLTAPSLLGLASITALGIGLVLSPLNGRYRDVPYMLPPLIAVLPLVSGVPYAIQEIPVKWQWIPRSIR